MSECNKEKKCYNSLKVKKPSFFVYWIPAAIIRFIVKILWRHKVDRSGLKKVKSPILAIANHCSTMDIVFSVQALLPKRFNVVTSKDVFTWKVLKPFIRKFGAIPKNQCAIDITCIKQIKKALENNNNVLIYPEGKTSLDGKELYYIAPSIAKFIKMMDVTVALVKTEGAYVTKPRWFHGFRRGRVETKTSVLLTQEEVRTLTLDEIYKRVTDALRFNDNIWQRENKVKFKHKHLAKDLDYILYKCPKCNAEYEMSTDDKYLTCNACGNKVEYTCYGELKPIGESVTFDRIDLWFDFCRQSVLEEIKKDDFFISKEADLWLEDKTKREYFKHGTGQLFMDKENIGYKGTKDGEYFELIQPLKLLPTLITKNEEGIDLIENDNTYRVLFTEHKWSSKYGLIAEMMFAYNNGLLDKE